MIRIPLRLLSVNGILAKRAQGADFVPVCCPNIETKKVQMNFHEMENFGS